MGIGGWDRDETRIKGATDDTLIGNVADSLKVVPVQDANLVDGKLFSHDHVHTLDNNITLYHLLKVPDTAIRVHYAVSVSVSAGGTVELFEDPTTTDDGTAVNIYNRNRNSVATATMGVYHSPTVTADGTLIEGTEFSSGGGNKGTDFVGNEISLILKQDTNYLVKYVSSMNGNKFSETHLWSEL